jgi:hypothetical protein
MILTKTIDRKNFYINFYKSLNYVLNLSNKELAILSQFAAMRANLPRDLNPTQLDAITFSSVNRKIIAESLGISIFNLNNYIKALKTKGLINGSGKHLTINPSIYVDINLVEKSYSNEFKFNIV